LNPWDLNFVTRVIRKFSDQSVASRKGHTVPESRPDSADGDVVTLLNAHSFTGAERFDAFYDKVSERLLPAQVSTENVATFRAGLRSANLGLVQMNELWASHPFVARRTSKHIARSDAEYLKVSVQLSGLSIVRQGGENITLRPGDFILYDTARPYQISGAASTHIQMLMFGRDALRLSPSQLQWLTFRRISGREGLGWLVAQYAAGLARQVDAVGSGAWHLADATLNLLAAAFADQLTHAGTAGLSNCEAGLLLRIRTHIEQRLDDPDLDVASIAAAHHVSVRRLQKLFADDEQTVTGWIRNRRIEHCRKDLANPALADRTVSSIATRWGMFDPAYFSRLFKSTYGLSPREYRIRALAEVRAKAS
jgi:AraC-like DNA-binding protein